MNWDGNEIHYGKVFTVHAKVEMYLLGTVGVVSGTEPIRALTGQDYSIFYSDPSSAELDLFVCF